MRRRDWLLLILTLATTAGSGRTEDFATLCSDRTAIERVYYNHRLGNKPPFEKTMPPGLTEKMVHEDLHKEAVLKKVYGVEITPAILDAEVQRINLSTRAPEILAELKAALGNDTNRFARTVAKPIIVERLLRQRFENDDQLHAAQRREVERVRETLLTAKKQGGSLKSLVALLKKDHPNEVTELTWNYNAADDTRSALAPGAHPNPSLYFDDLPPDLQKVLRAQLRQPADISGVIEMPNAFSLYVAKANTSELLSAAVLLLSKRSYEEWLKGQPDD